MVRVERQRPGLGASRGVGRRDRLMELFLPDKWAVESQKWNASRDANKALIEDMCPEEAPRPYHLINANVVLVDSKRTKYRERGGANFILSPLFCGSEATGWRRSRMYMKRTDPGMTLGTAMAISGAAANPYAGGGGSGWTRNRAVSIVMSMLSPKKENGEIPNFISPGITAVFLLRRLHEGNAVLALTDGGHFENLGLYELIRRELDTIIVCDASADPRGEDEALCDAVERIGVRIGHTVGRVRVIGAPVRPGRGSSRPEESTEWRRRWWRQRRGVRRGCCCRLR